MSEEKNVYLGQRDKVKINDSEFELRGLGLKESLLLGKILGNLVFGSLQAVTEDGDVNNDVITNLMDKGFDDIDAVESILCDVIGKDHGFLMEQDPSYFSGVLSEVLSRTNLKGMKENFTKAAKVLGMDDNSFSALKTLLPK